MISADLGGQLEGFEAELVKTGRYNRKSEVLRRRTSDPGARDAHRRA